MGSFLIDLGGESSSLRKRYQEEKLWKWNQWERKLSHKNLGGRDGDDEFYERNLKRNLGNEFQGNENMGLQNWGDMEEK